MTLSVQKENTDAILKHGRKNAVIGTIVIWGLFILFSAIVPLFPHKQKYHEVRITLEAAPVQHLNEDKKKAETPPAAAAPAAPKEMPAPPVKKDTSKPAVKQNAKTSAAKPVQKTAEKNTASKNRSKPVSSEKSTPKAPVKYAKSVDELMAEQQTSQKTSQWDDSIFDDSSESAVPQNSTSAVKQISAAEAFSGTAAAAAVADSKAVSSQVSSTGKAGGTSSAATSSALGKIRSTQYSQSAVDGVSSTVTMNTSQSSSGKTSIEMSDGSARVLLDPSKPNIIISKESAALIDSTRTVTIVFKVLAGGNVPLSGIEIKPSSTLPMQVQSEVRTQVARWRFAPDTYDGQARFEYTIMQR